MNARRWRLLIALIVVVVAGSWFAADAQNRQAGSASAASKAMPRKGIPTFSNENIARMGFFYAGGKYAGPPGKEVMTGAMYTEVWVPKQIRSPYPIVLFHGAGQTGTNWRQTPDDRAGWAYSLINRGYVVYMVDYPARGRSVYAPGIDGSLTIRTAPQLEEIWTNVKEKSDYFWKNNHTQWPGTGKMGDPIFDNFTKGQVQYLGGGENRSTELNHDAGVALLDLIGTPVILFTHSMGGNIGFTVADARPNLVKAIVTAEPGGGIERLNLTYDPPVAKAADIKTYKEEKGERPGENACVLQQEPVHKLVNLQPMRILDISGNGGYHRIGDACPPKWLNQAGVKTDFVRLEDVGIHGNGHEMFYEKNSDVIIKFVEDWIEKNVK
ncbi:MAG: alpha/beta fold hydrolase [Vicinamibacterales bacterium]